MLNFVHKIYGFCCECYCPQIINDNKHLLSLKIDNLKSDIIKKIVYLTQIQELKELSNNGEYDCYVCRNPFKTQIQFGCYHHLCVNCFINLANINTQENIEMKCPICRKKITKIGRIYEID